MSEIFKYSGLHHDNSYFTSTQYAESLRNDPIHVCLSSIFCAAPELAKTPKEVRAFTLLAEARKRHPEWEVKRLSDTEQTLDKT